jgi:hypothetical protein
MARFGFWWSGRGYQRVAETLTKFIPNSRVELYDDGSLALVAPSPGAGTEIKISMDDFCKELGAHPLSEIRLVNLFPYPFGCKVTQTVDEVVIVVTAEADKPSEGKAQPAERWVTIRVAEDSASISDSPSEEGGAETK